MLNQISIGILCTILLAQFVFLYLNPLECYTRQQSKPVQILILSLVYGSHLYSLLCLCFLLYFRRRLAQLLESIPWTLRLLNLVLLAWPLIFVAVSLSSEAFWWPALFYVFCGAGATMVLMAWVVLKKRKLDVHPITSKIERTAEDRDSIELEAQAIRKNKKLSEQERIRKLEANQFYLMQKWLIELESIDEDVVRRVRKEIRARSARTYFGLTLAERDRLVEMAKEDAIHEMKSRRGSTHSNRIYGNLGSLNPHYGRKAHSHANLLRVAEPTFLPLHLAHFQDNPLEIKCQSLDRIEEKASP